MVTPCFDWAVVFVAVLTWIAYVSHVLRSNPYRQSDRLAKKQGQPFNRG